MVHRLNLLALLCLSLVVFLGKGYETTFKDIDSSIHARESLNSISSEGKIQFPIQMPNSVRPETGKILNDQMPAQLWATNWIFKIFGPSSWSARILPSLFAAGTVWIAYLVGVELLGTLGGLFAGLVLLSSRLWVFNAASFHIDMGMIFFTWLALYYFWKHRWWAFGVASGVALCMKSPVALLPIAVAFLHLVVFHKNWSVLFKKWLPSTALALAIGASVWIFLGTKFGWTWVSDFWMRQVFGSALGGRDGAQSANYFMFFEILAKNYWPWLPFLLLGLFRFFQMRKEIPCPQIGHWKSVLLVLVVGIVGVSISRFKFDYYFLPVFPALALFAAYGLHTLFQRWQTKIESGFAPVVLLANTFLLVTPTPLAPEFFPALRKWNSVVYNDLATQRVGCDSKILMVSEGAREGNAVDFVFYLNFYTGREVVEASCGSLSQVSLGNVEWFMFPAILLTSCPHLEKLQSYFPSRWQHAGWQLWTTAKESKTVNLDVFNHDAKAFAGCR